MTHTNTEGLSDELLAKMIARQTLERDQYMSGTFLFVRHDERVKAFTELLSRRAANSVGGVEVLSDAAEALERSLESEGAGVNAYLRDDIEQAISVMRSSHAVEAEPVAWQHKLTGIIRTDKPAVGMGLHEDYAPLYTHPSSPVSAEVTEAMVDAAIPHLRNLNIAGKDAWRKAVHNALLAALNGGRENG